LRGEELFSGASFLDLSRAAAEYERAVALDPAFVQAWIQLSRTRSIMFGQGRPSAATADGALEAAQRAAALAPGSPDVLKAMGDYYSYVAADNRKALEYYAEAQREAPLDAEILSGAALSEMSLGRWEEALEHLREAHRLDPRDGTTTYRLARTLLWLERYDEAMVVADENIVLEPSNAATLQQKAMIHVARGDIAAARGLIANPPREIDPAELAMTMAVYWDLYWLLSGPQQDLLLRLPVTEFTGG